MTEKLEKFRLTIKMGDKKLIFFRPVGVTGIANHILGQPPSILVKIFIIKHKVIQKNKSGKPNATQLGKD